MKKCGSFTWRFNNSIYTHLLYIYIKRFVLIVYKKKMAEVYTEKCARCGLEIEDELEITLLKKHYHPDCMVCHQCKISLTGKPVHVHEGNLYDQECFFAFHAKCCDICRKPITGANVRFLTSADKSFHPACYVCFHCRKTLSGVEYYMVGENRVCVPCVKSGIGVEL